MERIRLLLQKVKPLYPQQADKLWKLYLVSDSYRKREIEEMIGRLVASKDIDTVDDRIVLPPPDKDQSEGQINIGNVSYLDKNLYPISLKLPELTRHMGIFGSTGTGKTTLARHIVRDLYKNKVPFIIFDWEENYRGLIKEL